MKNETRNLNKESKRQPDQGRYMRSYKQDECELKNMSCEK